MSIYVYICIYICIYSYVLMYYEGFTLVTCTCVYVDIYRFPTCAINNDMYIFNTYYAEALYPTAYIIAYNIYITIFNYTYVYTHT